MISLAARPKQKKNRALRLLLIAVAVALVLAYVGYQIYLIAVPSVKTQTAFPVSEYKTVNTKVYVIRQESEISGNASGVVVPAVENGSRVANGDTVAYVFADQASAENYAKSLTLKEEIARCDSFAANNAAPSDVERLDDDVDTAFLNFLKALDSGDFRAAGENSTEFNDTLTRFKIATGEQIDFTQKKAELQAQLDTLNAGIRQNSAITAAGAGYYVGSTDGYEHSVDYAAVPDLTVEQVENLLSDQNQPSQGSDGMLGKLIQNFDWYLACVVRTEEIAELQVGDSVSVALPNAVAEHIETTVKAVNNGADGRAALILECNLMNEQLATLRLEEAQIILEEYDGLKIPSGAVRVNSENEKGVFVIKGNIALFKKIDILYSDGEYVLIDPNSENNEVKIYDQVVTEGKDISDGKIID